MVKIMNNTQNIISSMIQIMQSGNNPEVLINNLAKNNPQFQAILNQKAQSGMSWKDFTIQIARQNNIDLTPYIQGLQQKGIKM